jgi:hypothetical protein
MDVFDRYLQAVRSLLPKSLRDDVVRELSEELRSQAEEREAEVGRPLTQVEQEQILKQWGHPWMLAARYQPRRQLVGPAMFPFYWLVLKVGLGVALLVHAIAAAVLLANGKPASDVIARLATLPFGPLLMVFAWVTLVFAVLDRSVPRLPFIMNWNPSSLPHAGEQSGAPSMASRIGEVVMGTVFVLWLAALPYNQWLVFGPAAALVELAPVWFDLHHTLLLLASAGLAVSWARLLYPQRHTFFLAAKVAGHIVSVVVFWFLVNADALIVATQAPGAGEAVAAAVNGGLRIAFMVVVIVAAVEAVREAIRLIRRLRVPRYSSF